MRTTRLAVAMLTIATAAALPAAIPKAPIEHAPVVATTSHTVSSADNKCPTRRSSKSTS
jgi:hypothetical protein